MSGQLHVHGLGKAYRHWRSEWLRAASWFGLPVKASEEHWVLRDVEFSIMPGETVGIIGQNGAGKSTLLKLITGTTRPSEGTIVRTGRVAAILELGMGFSPDLTGRQNAYHSAGLMGYSQQEIVRAMPGIEEFAEIGKYFDEPVRTYSSGMQMRVAFSVATAFKPDLLIVDEALSVGDSYFQHKSFDRIRQFRGEGVSIMLVTHSLGDVRSLCDRVILLDQGRVLRDGTPDEVVDYYNALTVEKENSKLPIKQRRDKGGWVRTEYGTEEARVLSVRLLDLETGAEVVTARVGQQLVIETRAAVSTLLPRLILGHRITDRTGHVVWGSNTWHTRQALEDVEAGSVVTFRSRFTCTLGQGSYAISLGLVSSDTQLENCYHRVDNPVVFDVLNADRPLFVGSCWLDNEFDVQVETGGARAAPPLRIAIISTPRSGNTWLRRILAGAYLAEELAVHTPDDVDWERLPDGNLVLQLHWSRSIEFESLLRKHGFRTIVLHRHPLDVLLSILQFAPREPQTSLWLSGKGGDEQGIQGAVPTSQAFIDYATGARASALLDISADWSGASDAIAVGYEELVADPVAVVRGLVSRIGPASADIEQVVDDNTIERLRSTSSNGHFWQGQPGLWRSVVPERIAMLIAAAQGTSFERFGYQCNADATLDVTDAATNWRLLVNQ